MGTLRIHMLGRIRIETDFPSADLKIIPTIQPLLAYIILNRAHHLPREILAELFWGNRPEAQARNCLSTALWRLRRVLEPCGVQRGTYLTDGLRGEIGFNRQSDYWLDVEAFEQYAGQLSSHPGLVPAEQTAENLQQAISLYQGNFLEGVYQDWVLVERERLRSLYMDCLGWLLEFHKSHQAYEPAIAFGQQILHHDPLREEIHRELMRLFCLNGQRAQAVQQYEVCRQILSRELGIPPMLETRHLHEQILSDECPPRFSSAAGNISLPGEQSNLDHALQQLRAAMQQLDDIRRQVDNALRMLDQPSQD